MSMVAHGVQESFMEMLTALMCMPNFCFFKDIFSFFFFLTFFLIAQLWHERVNDMQQRATDWN